MSADTTATRAAIQSAAAILTEHPRDGWMCCFGSRHTDGPCKACLSMWEREAAKAAKA